MKITRLYEMAIITDMHIILIHYPILHIRFDINTFNGIYSYQFFFSYFEQKGSKTLDL